VISEVNMGLLGGTFDPPHLAHVELARSAIRQLGLSRLLVIPTGQPWHRRTPPSAAHHRLAMCRLAFAELPEVEVDDRETRRSGPTYTIDTVRELKSEWPQAVWHLIIGADQAQRFGTWHQHEQLLCLVHIVVADRDPEAGRWQNTVLMQAQRLTFKPMDISATAIRSCVAQGLTAPGLQPQVQDYVLHHQLYKAPPT
jgi:nicotinate-nucleotide adenylyltransferase